MWVYAEQWVSEALFALERTCSATTKEAVKEVDNSSHTDSHVEHMEVEGEESHVTSESGVDVATPAPVSISVMQMITGSSRHRSHRFSAST